MKEKTGGAKSIETPFLKVKGNCLEIENTAIQLSSISLFSTADVTPEKFPVWSIALIVVGLLLVSGGTEAALLAVIGLVIIAAGGGWIYLWYSKTQATKCLKRLTIITNSGNAFPIIFNDKAFMEEVVTLMRDIIRDPGTAWDVTINIENCTLRDNSSITKGK